MVNNEQINFGVKKKIIGISVFAALLMVVVLAFYFSKFNVSLSSENGDWGTFGDFLGGTLNPIFSLMSLVALLYTIVLQTDEMAQTREELKRTADAQKNAEIALNGQLEAQRKQLFESTFFSLLDQHNKALERFVSQNLNRSDKSSDLGFIRQEIFKGGHRNIEEQRGIVHKHNNICGSYFRVLYRILKFISESCYDNDKQKLYSGIVRSFIGNDVIQILACNCYCNDNNDQYWKYKILIENYEFLEHFSPFVDSDEFFDKVIDCYDIKAFGENPLNLMPRNRRT